MAVEVLKKGKCPHCKKTAFIIMYQGEKKIDHAKAADTKECRKLNAVHG